MLLLLQLTLAQLIAVALLPRLPKHDNRLLKWLQAAALRVLTFFVCINISMQPDHVLALIPAAFMLAALDVSVTETMSTSWLAFLAAQLVQACIILAFWSVLDLHDFGRVERLLTAPSSYVVAVTYVAAIFGGGELVRRVTVGFLAEMKAEQQKQKPGLPSAGQYIGWLERFLIVSFVLTSNSEAIGFLIAAKTLVRFPEIRGGSTEDYFPEYFLVGTLTSVGIALALSSAASLLL